MGKAKRESELLKPGEDPNHFETEEVEGGFVVKAEKMDAVGQAEAAFIPPNSTIVDVGPIKVEPTKEKPKEEKHVNNAVIQLNERGVANPHDIETGFRVAKALFQGKGFPNWVKSAEQAFAVSQFLRSLNLDVMTGIQHVCEVNGRLTLWGEGPLAAVRASNRLKSIKEIFLTKDYKEISLKNKNLDAELFAVVCTMVRDDGERVERAFTLADELKANQGIPAIWKGYKRIMYKRKARAECIKDLFGDVILGAGIAEYDFETAPDLNPTGEPQPSLAERLNQKALPTPDEKEIQN